MRENPNPRPVPVDLVKVRTRAASASNDHFDDGAGSISDDFSSFDNQKPAGLSKGHLHLQRHRRMEVGLGGLYVSINITDYSRMELQDLKWRLISELEKVRVLMSRIKTGDLQILKYAGCSASSWGVGSGGGAREVMSADALPLILPQFSSQLLEHRPSASGDQYLQMPESFLRPIAEYKHGKHSKRSQPLSSPREAKRQVPIAESEKILGDIMRKCSQILMKLMKHKWGWVFNTPVDAAGMRLDDYHQIIKRPMDLGTVKSQLEKSAYSSPMDFAADVRLTFNNALLYNPAGHKVHVMAEMLLNLFEKLFAEASDACGMQKHTHVNGSREDQKKSRSAWPHRPVERRLDKVPPAGIAASAPASLLPPVVPVSASPLLHTVAHVHSSVDPPAPHQPVAPPSPKLQPTPPAVARSARGKQPKPKAKDPNKREMSFHEKKKLSMELQNLPQEKMAQVLQIVQRRNADPAVHGDEIELDFEILDMETLWELDRFVCNCKKMMSKMRRQEAKLAMAPPMVEITEKTEIMLPAMVMMTGPSAHNWKDKKGGEPGEENVDIGEETPSSQFPPTEIRKATGYPSDLTRYSSKSSSSDSDSRSSSESCSDADVQSPAVV